MATVYGGLPRCLTLSACLCSPDLCDGLQLSWPLPLSFVLFLGCLSLICFLRIFSSSLAVFWKHEDVCCSVFCVLPFLIISSWKASWQPVHHRLVHHGCPAHYRPVHHGGPLTTVQSIMVALLTTVQSHRGLCLPLTELIPGCSCVCDARGISAFLLKREPNVSSRSTIIFASVSTHKFVRIHTLTQTVQKACFPGPGSGFSRMVLNRLE